MSLATEFGEYLDAGARGFWLPTFEEQRAIGELQRANQERGRLTLTWSAPGGLTDSASGNIFMPAGASEGGPANDMLLAIQTSMTIPNHPNPTLVLCDPHHYLNDSKWGPVIRSVREVTAYKKATVVCLTTDPTIPLDLRRQLIQLELTLPNAEELAQVARRIKNVGSRMAGSLAEAARALTGFEAEIIMRRALNRHGSVVEQVAQDIWNTKAKMLQARGITIRRPTGSFDRVGGVYHFKKILQENKWAFSEEGRKRGLAPKGYMLAGPPGTGKTLIGTSLAGELGWNFASVNMAEFYDPYQGVSEMSLREGLQCLRVLAPVVAFFDEARHQFRGAESSGVTDSGTSARLVGDVLKFMNDREEPILALFATNEPWDMPPHMLRSGRIDAAIGVLNPRHDAAEDILFLHLDQYFGSVHKVERKAGRDLALEMVGRKFSGSDIAQVIIDVARKAGTQPVTIEMLQAATRARKAYAEMMPEHVERNEQWCRAHAICEPESGNQ